MATTEPSDLNNAKLIQLYSDEKKTEKAYPIVNRESIINSDGTNTFDYLENKLNTDIEDFKDEMDNTLGSDITTIRETIKSNKITNEENKRKIDALLKLGEGITHEFQTDETVKYQKDIPKGAELVSIKKIGGKSIVWNQMNKTNKFDSSGNSDGSYIMDAELDDDGFCTLTKDITLGLYVVGGHIDEPIIAGNVYYVKLYTNNKITIPSKSAVRVRYDEQETGNTLDNDYTKHNLCSYRFKAPANGSILCNSYLQFIPGSGETIVCNDFKWRISTFNLTKMFGVGKEPTQEEFENMLEYEYYEYSKPTIIHNTIFSVQEQGQNLINMDEVLSSYGFTKETDGYSITPTSNILGKSIFNWMLNSQIILSYDSKFIDTQGQGLRFKFVYTDGSKTTLYPSNNFNKFNHSSFTSEAGKVIKYITMDYGYQIKTYIKNLQIIKKDTLDVYSPYHKNIYEIPQEILNLDNFGWGINDACNYIDFETKTYHKKIGSVDLGDFTYETITIQGNKCFYSHQCISDFKGDTSNNYNAMCLDYYISSDPVVYNKKNKHLCPSISTNQQLSGYGLTTVYIHDESYTDPAELKKALKGVILYYELKEEEVIDISDIIPDNFLESLSVEEYGSLTFKNNLNMGLQIPVQSTEEYCVKLSDE